MSTRLSLSRKKDILKFFVIFAFVFSALYFIATVFGHTIKQFSSKVYSVTITLEYLKSALEISIIALGILRGRALWNWLKSKLRQREFKGTGEEFDYINEKVKAIVIPVSRREQPEWIIRHLQPDYVAFLYTEKTKDVAIELIREFSDTVHFLHTVKEIEENVDIIKNPDDPYETKIVTKRFIERFKNLGIREENIFVDTTGGKVPMSIGAFQASGEMNVSSIYVVGKVRGIIEDPRVKEHGFPIFMSQHEK